MDLMRTLSPALLVATILALPTAPAAAAPAAAKECTQCHGDNGVSQNKDIPTIAGMSAFYLDGQIQAYQKGQRPCPKTKYPNDPAKPATDMCAMAKNLSPADSAVVDKYFASLPALPAKQTLDAGLAAKGKSIHDAHCEICHSNGGSFADDDAGILAGQWMPYLVATLTDYHDGKRIQPDKMKPQTAALSAEDIKALAEFYASEDKKK